MTQNPLKETNHALKISSRRQDSPDLCITSCRIKHVGVEDVVLILTSVHREDQSMLAASQQMIIY